MIKSKGILFIVSAPSGAGKTTLLKKVMADLPQLCFSVSHTTRKPRTGESDGREYFFVDHKKFEEIRDQKPSGFLEWANVHDQLYGTSCNAVESGLKQTDIILDIDVQGARLVRDAREAVCIFVAPPSLDELERRLRNRNTDSNETIAIRLKNAHKELSAIQEYDYLIINDQIERAADTLRAIIIAERSRKRRNREGKQITCEARN